MPNKRILVVEDDSDSQEMVATILRHINFIVDTADDGEEASQMISEAKEMYDAILIDLALPGKDGFQLLAEILENPETENVPCVAVTAFHTSKLREEALISGFTAYFPKPVDATMLGRELEGIIQ